MWDKTLRQLVFTGIYEYFFWGVEFDESQLDWSLIVSLNKFEENFDTALAQEKFKYFTENRISLEEVIKPYMVNWDRTFDIVKAIIFTALIELNDIQIAEEKDKSIGKYIHLTQDMIGGKNPALVHAVLSKIVGKKQELK